MYIKQSFTMFENVKHKEHLRFKMKESGFSTSEKPDSSIGRI